MVAQAANDGAAMGKLRWEGKPTPTTLQRAAAKARQRLQATAAAGPLTDPAVQSAAAVLSAPSYEAVKVVEQCAREAAKKEEDNLAAAREQAWKQWLHGGPAHGLGRQHRFARVQAGWIPTDVGMALHQARGSDAADIAGSQRREGQHDESYQEEGYGGRILKQTDRGMAPLGLQGIVDDQAMSWAEHWAADADLPAPDWPANINECMMPRPSVGQLRQALVTFPAATALG